MAVENQQEKVDKATADVEAVVQQMREGDSRAQNEIREIREEVSNIREMIPKVINFYLLYNAYGLKDAN